ncbi:DUF2357 domain-containing protein [Xanthomonas translucens pv. undulosa]|uniref:DUF2357 domain-containing protein n=1 Tax=Xanthomonas campestris pv. translucens TaxID=343 RepID=UPI001AF441AE|nr:DUF2357 domain-containing protein [Xanthomonas translucens]QSQ52107.1 DUF2357 domain-containing protein [Xanthomonas translucens pv. undulosa]QSQ58975.1 DUF2357 domain-containing protein [Xanthomonas translucens pv. undulosa]
MSTLHIHSEGGGPAWQVWPSQDVIPAGAIREASSYLFELKDSDDAIAADLLIDDIPVEALRSRQLRNARWRWTPGFHAGSVEATLKLPGQGIHRFEITTDPDQRKLTRDDFDTMVREVLEDTFALFSLSSFRKGIARQPGNRAPPIARLEFLRSRANEITKAISAINRSPRHFLRAESVTLPFHRARRATGPEIIKSLKTGLIRTEASGPSRLPTALNGRLPAQITMRQRRNSVDIPEHRQIKACLRSWATWLSGVADVLNRTDRGSDAENFTTAGSWAIRIKHIARKLKDATNSGFMSDVSVGPAMLQLSSLFRNDTAYSRFYRLWQDMNLGLAALFGDFLQMPLARTYELYELWCFLRLLRAAIDEFGQTDVDLSELFTTDAAGGVTISAGSVTVSVGAGRTLCFQRQYREYWLEPSGEGSFSRTMVPDLVFAGAGLGSMEKQVIVLDAKYRIDEGLNDALSSIHTYRDALVQEAESGEIAGIVTAAYLLTPHVPLLEKDFRRTPVPGRLFHPQYREKFRFGAVTLRPGMNSEELRNLLRTIVADASGAP